MTIRSVDMQVLVQKVNDVTKIQQTQQVEGQNRQQESAQNIAAQTERVSRTVNQTLRNQGKKVQGKEEHEEGNQGKKRERKSGGKEEKSTQTDPESLKKGLGIDITI